jgi:hypothetical protein
MPELLFTDIDWSSFWDDNKAALEDYVDEPPTDELVRSIQEELGYKLPASYIKMMKIHNGGMPKNNRFPTKQRTSWAKDHIAINGILGIGRNKDYSLCGGLGSQFMIDEWEYPAIGICICDCPSAGHDMIMLDYRECGPEGEPTVVHVDQERDYRMTFLAKDFESFICGLVHEDVYDTSAEDLKRTLVILETGRFSALLQEFIEREDRINFDKILRAILIELTRSKGYFALHDDPSSFLVYDIQFFLFSRYRHLSSKEEYLKEYPKMIALGDGEITTRGYAPGFVDDWYNKRWSEQSIRKRLLGGLEWKSERELLKSIERYTA